MDKQQSRLKEFLPIVVAALFIGLILTPGLLNSPIKFQVDERSISYAPDRILTARSLINFYAPWWNPYNHCGTAHFAAIHTGVLYPLNWFIYLLPLGLAISLDHLLHRALAFVGMWMLARLVGLRREGAWMAALAFTLSGYLLVHQVHVPMMQTVCWLPIVVAVAIKARDEARWAAAGALLLSLLFFIGYPQMFIFSAGVYCLFAFNIRPAKSLVPLIATVALMFLITSVQWIPTRDFVKETMRQKMTYEEFISYSHSLKTLPLFFFPALFGTPLMSKILPQSWSGPYNLVELNQSLTLIAWLFLPVGLIFGRCRDRWRWVALAIISLFVGLGTVFGLAPLLYKIPVLNQFKVLTRYAIGFLLAASIFAGAGLDAFYQIEKARRKKIYIVFGCVASILLIMNLICWLFPHSADMQMQGIAVPFLTLVVGLAVLLPALSLSNTWKYTRALRTAAFLVLAVVLLVEYSIYHKAQYIEWAETKTITAPRLQSPVYNNLASLALDYPADHHPGRFMLCYKQIGDYDTNVLYPAVNIIHRVPGVVFYGPFLPRKIIGFLGLMNTGIFTNMDFMLNYGWVEKTASRYTVTSSRTPEFLLDLNRPFKDRPDRFRLVENEDNESIFEVTDSFPWMQWVTDYREYDKDESEGRNVWGPDGWRDVWIRQRGGRTPETLKGAQAAINTNLKAPHRLTFDVDAEGPGVIVIRERKSEGWKVLVDGEETRLWEVDVLFMGAAVPEGSHHVEFRYAPPRIAIGFCLFLFGLAITTVWLCRGRIEKIICKRCSSTQPLQT